MSIDGTSNDNADILANTLFGTLTAGNDFSLPAINLSGPEFTTPSETGNALYADITKLTEADLTDRNVNGSGLFDGLMQAMKAHIQVEYEKGRITGEEYAKVYIAAIQSALGSSVQYLLATDQAYWQAVMAQKQAQAAEVGVITARLQNETAKANLASARLQTQSEAAKYALAKIQLSTSDIQYSLLQAQVAQAEYQNASILPAQLAQLQKETERLNYELVNMMPKELTRIDKQIEQASAQISMTAAQKDQVLYQTSALMPAQLLGIQAETDVKEYQATTLLPAQVSGYTADTTGKIFTNDFLLPAQLVSLNEQTEGHRAKTSETRMDGVTPIAGAIGKQKALHQQQIDSYKRDAEAKIGKMLLDTWITQKSLDEGLAPPTSLTDANINTVMGHLRTNLGLG